eukprot:gene27199-44231_t
MARKDGSTPQFVAANRGRSRGSPQGALAFARHWFLWSLDRPRQRCDGGRRRPDGAVWRWAPVCPRLPGPGPGASPHATLHPPTVAAGGGAATAACDGRHTQRVGCDVSRTAGSVQGAAVELPRRCAAAVGPLGRHRLSVQQRDLVRAGLLAPSLGSATDVAAMSLYGESAMGGLWDHSPGATPAPPRLGAARHTLPSAPVAL